MAMILGIEDADIVLELRQLNTGRKSQYDVFWSDCLLRKLLDQLSMTGGMEVSLT